jgi:hypothetical protein
MQQFLSGIAALAFAIAPAFAQSGDKAAPNSGSITGTPPATGTTESAFPRSNVTKDVPMPDSKPKTQTPAGAGNPPDKRAK